MKRTEHFEKNKQPKTDIKFENTGPGKGNLYRNSALWKVMKLLVDSPRSTSEIEKSGVPSGTIRLAVYKNHTNPNTPDILKFTRHGRPNSRTKGSVRFPQKADNTLYYLNGDQLRAARILVERYAQNSHYWSVHITDPLLKRYLIKYSDCQSGNYTTLGWNINSVEDKIE